VFDGRLDGTLVNEMAKAWEQAARDLAIRFVSPYRFTDSAGREHVCTGWLPDFGGQRGALVLSRHDSDDSDLAGEEAGFYVSGLNPSWYEQYERSRFMSTLNDWGWYGAEEDAPGWFSGHVRGAPRRRTSA
jgi:hypothetical protein